MFVDLIPDVAGHLREVVLHLPKLGHDLNGICLARCFLDLRVLWPHEDIVLLLIPNSKLALRLLIFLGEGLKT